ncbi:LA_3751/LA_3752 family putative glycosyltransferase [Leptospira ryugenii]|nr:hypothetical protein [Leptospira ryugenii]
MIAKHTTSAAMISKNPKLTLFLAYSLSIALSFFAQIKNENTFVQDEQYKFLQIEEFIDQNFTRFDRPVDTDRYPNTDEYSQFHPPFEYKIGDRKFFTFPLYFSALVAIPYKFMGFWGIFIIPVAFGLLSLLIFYELVLLISKDKKISFLSSLFYLFGSSLLIYSTWLYEATLTNFLFFLSLYLYFKYDHWLSIFLNGFAIGMLAFIRLEVVLFLAIVLFYFFIFTRTKVKITLTFLVFAIFLAIQLYLNYVMTGFALPIRFFTTVLNQFTISFRLFRIVEYFFISQYSFLFYIPVSFLTLSVLFQKKYSTIQYLLLGVFSIWIIFPFFGPNQQGMDLSPRFLFPIVPIFGFLTIQIVYQNFRKKKTLLIILFFLIPVFRMLIMLFILRETQKIYDYTHHFFKQNVNKQVLISSEHVNNFIYNLKNIRVYDPKTQENAETFITMHKGKNFSIICLEGSEINCQQLLQNIDPKESFRPVEKVKSLSFYNSK